MEIQEKVLDQPLIEKTGEPKSQGLGTSSFEIQAKLEIFWFKHDALPFLGIRLCWPQAFTLEAFRLES
jgi:hypothetical protein